MTTENKKFQPATRVVAPKQLSDGFIRLDGVIGMRCQFQVIRILPDGNYLVVDPKVR